MQKLSVTNPRSGEIDYHVACHDRTDVERRVTQLRAAQPDWEALGVDGRCAVLKKWQAAIARHAEQISTALCIDTGRHLMSRIETSAVGDWIEHWLTKAPELLGNEHSGTSQMAPSVHWHHHLKPYPVVGIISPWNVPLILGLIDLVPALAAGCSVLLKPSEITPRFAQPLQASIDEVPELAGVLKIVTGDGATGQAMIDQVDAVCFTGSVATGRKVAIQAAENFIPAFLELGGKDPAIVLPDADLDNAATAILRSAAGLTGQACQSLERIYVHQSILPDFVNLLVTKAEEIGINWPDLHDGHLGPFIFPPQAEMVQAHLDDAVRRGAKIRTGGLEQHGGWWCRPTVLTGVDHSMQIMREETFGPILPVMSFTNNEEALRLANDSQFGLSGAVFGDNREEAEALAAKITGGAISVNDASLTGMVHDVEKNSFCLSGMGGSRMGDAGLTRFLRKRAILYQSQPAGSLTQLNEAFANPANSS